MDYWIKELANYYNKLRQEVRNEKLLIIFDIDGTIVDMRYAIYYVLKSYDDINQTTFFEKLQIKDIDLHENRIQDLLILLLVPPWAHKNIINYYQNQLWSYETILNAHKPFQGVFEVIRWFQIQYTAVGLNTGRPETLRDETLQSLNTLGKEFRVKFDDKFLWMRKSPSEEDVPNSKAEGVKYFQEIGYKVFAFIDNEPENLAIISTIDPQNEILLLHANTLFVSRRKKKEPKMLSGKYYDVIDLLPENHLPKHIQFVWQSMSNRSDFPTYLLSNVQWAGLLVTKDNDSSEIVLGIDQVSYYYNEFKNRKLPLVTALEILQSNNKSAKIDIPQNREFLDEIIQIVQQSQLTQENIWFHGNIEILKPNGFKKLSQTFPEAIIQCSIDPYLSMLLSKPWTVKKKLDQFSEYGINRFSIQSNAPEKSQILDQLEEWSYECNIYKVLDLESFLQAILLLPTSISSDFNFPRWKYFHQKTIRNIVFNKIIPNWT
ncbi:MAG: HAD family hydrolase [Candidatus Thorarchaeota archaeon]